MISAPSNFFLQSPTMPPLAQITGLLRPSNAFAAFCRRPVITKSSQVRQSTLFHQRGGWHGAADCWPLGWKDPETSEKIFRCTLMRTNSRGAFIIACRCCWATPGKPERGGVELLRPTPNTFMRMWPISKRVNVSGRGNDDPSQIERYKPKPGFLARKRSVTLEELRARREIDMNEECPKELGDGARQ